jgi:hypothetical protein
VQDGAIDSVDERALAGGVPMISNDDNRSDEPRLVDQSTGEAGLFEGAEPEVVEAAAAAPDTIARAYELARGGLHPTIELIAEQLKAERLEAVDARLFDPAIRKSLRQACADGRIAMLARARTG